MADQQRSIYDRPSIIAQCSESYRREERFARALVAGARDGQRLHQQEQRGSGFAAYRRAGGAS